MIIVVKQSVAMISRENRRGLELVSKELNHFGVIAYLFRQIGGHSTVKPRDTRPQAARTLQVHVFELGPKIFEMKEFL